MELISSMWTVSRSFARINHHLLCTSSAIWRKIVTSEKNVLWRLKKIRENHLSLALGGGWGEGESRVELGHEGVKLFLSVEMQKGVGGPGAEAGRQNKDSGAANNQTDGRQGQSSHHWKDWDRMSCFLSRKGRSNSKSYVFSRFYPLIILSRYDFCEICPKTFLPERFYSEGPKASTLWAIAAKKDLKGPTVVLLV